MIHRMSTAENTASAPVPRSAPVIPRSAWTLVPKPKNPIAPTMAATSPTSPALAADHRNAAMRRMIRASGAVAIKAAIQLSVDSIWPARCALVQLPRGGLLFLAAKGRADGLQLPPLLRVDRRVSE